MVSITLKFEIDFKLMVLKGIKQSRLLGWKLNFFRFVNFANFEKSIWIGFKPLQIVSASFPKYSSLVAIPNLKFNYSKLKNLFDILLIISFMLNKFSFLKFIDKSSFFIL